jgi:CHRD domain/Ig domain of plant-specific actin-binding protein
MKRFVFSFAVIAGVLAIGSGSALGQAGRTAASPPTESSLPTISGTVQAGHTLTASSGTWGGATPITYAYEWQLCNSAGTGCGAINGAASQNYVVSGSDAGKTIRVQVTATNSDGTNQALSAATATAAAAGAAAPVNTKQPNPSGTAANGQTIRVDNGSWSGSRPISFTYQWQSCTTPNPVCTDLAGATGSSYLIGPSQVGSTLRATVTATNSAGKFSTFSNLTATVVAKSTSPVNTSLPVITGSLSVGNTLQASSGVWTGLSTNPFAYQWSRCNADGTSCATIAGATKQSYGVGTVDVGNGLRVSVTATNAAGATSATSASSAIAARLVANAGFTAVLRAGQEVNGTHRVPSGAAGHFTAKLTGKSLRWTLTFSHLSGRPTIAGLNRGLRGASGVAFKTLCRGCISAVHGTLTLTASQTEAMLRGGTYVNIHTARNRQGEIRGQLRRVS